MRMRTYYWRGRENFGDALTPILLREFAGITPEWARKEDAEIVVCGSVLQGMPAAWDGTVLGSGRLRATGTVPSLARVLALRGPLSMPGTSAPYGDPALLVPLLIERPASRWDVGIVPHWSDPELRAEDGHIINVGGSPLDVVREIASCRRIISSSLHGVIVAHAFDIPAQARMCERVKGEGGWFKFRDYAGAYGLGTDMGTWKPPVEDVAALQRGLLEAFKEAGR